MERKSRQRSNTWTASLPISFQDPERLLQVLPLALLFVLPLMKRVPSTLLEISAHPSVNHYHLEPSKEIPFLTHFLEPSSPSRLERSLAPGAQVESDYSLVVSSSLQEFQLMLLRNRVVQSRFRLMWTTSCRTSPTTGRESLMLRVKRMVNTTKCFLL